MRDKLEWINRFWQFSVRGFLPLIRKDSTTHMHGLAVYEKEGLPFAQDFSFENSTDSYLCFLLVLLHSVSYFFSLYQSPSLSYAQFSILFYLWMCLSSDTSTSIIRTGWPILMELIDLVNSAIIYLSLMTLCRWLTFLLGSHIRISQSCFFGFIYFFWC